MLHDPIKRQRERQNNKTNHERNVERNCLTVLYRLVSFRGRRFCHALLNQMKNAKVRRCEMPIHRFTGQYVYYRRAA